MKKKEWQKFHGLDDEEMEFISKVLKMFNGTIVRVIHNEEEMKAYEAELVRDKRDYVVPDCFRGGIKESELGESIVLHT